MRLRSLHPALLEWQHLLARLQVRSPEQWTGAMQDGLPSPQPLLVVVPGDVEECERTA